MEAPKSVIVARIFCIIFILLCLIFHCKYEMGWDILSFSQRGKLIIQTCKRSANNTACSKSNILQGIADPDCMSLGLLACEEKPETVPVQPNGNGFLRYISTLLALFVIMQVIDVKGALKAVCTKDRNRHLGDPCGKSSRNELYDKPREFSPAWDFMFEFRNVRANFCVAYPFTVNQYVDDIVKERASAEELMKYEWSRYLSFKTFPMDSIVTPMRLAQAGFYYTGHGEQVKCFCCGVTNGSWSSDESAVEVHKRLSPNCHFIRRESNDNVEIHNKEYYDEIYRQFQSVDLPGATGGPSDRLGSRGSNPEVPTTDLAKLEKDKVSPAEVVSAKQKTASATETQLGGNVKHPDFSDLATRVSSFLNWTVPDIQDPADLASAGFFYTGVRDFVRCFYCGAGLKNWEKGDNPIQEHSRWSPTCGYLQQLNNSGGAACHSETKSSPNKAKEAAATPLISNYENSVAANSDTSVTSGPGAHHVTNSAGMEAAGALKTGYSSGPGEDSERTNDEATKARLLKEKNTSLRRQLMCKICMDNDANVVFLPCGHMVACQTCAVPLRKCAVCRKLIKGSVRVFQG